jgi:hypothetical protein
VTAQAFSGVLFSHSDVAEMLEEYDYLLRIACQHRERIPGCIVARRRALAELATCATTYADLRGDAPEALDGSHFGLGVVDTATAAKELGMTGAGVRDLCRRRRLIAMQPDGPGTSWYIARTSIDAYLARRSA